MEHIPAKVRMMYYMPALEEGKYPFAGFSREECAAFLDRSAELAVHAIEEVRSLLDSFYPLYPPSASGCLF